MMEDASREDLASELDQLQDLASSLDQQLAVRCEMLLQEFARRYPPLKRVDRLEIHPDTLLKWLAEHQEPQP